MPKSRRRKIITKRPKDSEFIHAALTVFPVYYEQTEQDVERFGRIANSEADIRKAAGAWPNEADNSEMGLMRIGRALRQVSERAEIEFYRPVTDWLHTHRQHRHHVTSYEQGLMVKIEFTTEAGRLDFRRAFPHWVTQHPQQWMDDAGLETGQNKYDLPDEYQDGDGQHRRAR
jgi:hypothetical protein